MTDGVLSLLNSESESEEYEQEDMDKTAHEEISAARATVLRSLSNLRHTFDYLSGVISEFKFVLERQKNDLSHVKNVTVLYLFGVTLLE